MNPLSAARCAVMLIFFAGLVLAGCDSSQNGDGQDMTVPTPPPTQEESMPGLPQTPETPPPIGEAQLKKAAVAYNQIQEINRKLQQDIQQPLDADEKQQLQQEANLKMAEAIESAGLDFDTYNSIMSQTRINNELNERFQNLVMEAP